MSITAPHLCTGCGLEGELLCENCKYDIISEPFLACVACGKRIPGASGLCRECKVPYARAWCVADRRDQLEQLIDSYKFRNAKQTYKPLAELLHRHLPELPAETVIVSVPTVNSHIRKRGYDHMLLIVKQFGKLRSLPVDTSLQRVTSATQRGVGRAQRICQAKSAFACKESLDPRKIYLLIDDVITTGATVKYAARTLKDAGANEIWVASISRQPLDLQR